MTAVRAWKLPRWLPALMMGLGFVLFAGAMGFAIATGSSLPSPDATPEEALRIERLSDRGIPFLLGGELLFVLGFALVLAQIAAFALRRLTSCAIAH